MMTSETFRTESTRAYELMRDGDLISAGVIYEKLYSVLRMNTYRQRLAKRRFDKVFFGLTPDDVLGMLYNRVTCHLNGCDTQKALQSIHIYKQIEKDFNIDGVPDLELDLEEIEAYRRLGENKKAIALCDKFLKKKLDSPYRVEALITKGSIESDESHQIFGINSLSLALAEAEEDGTPELIAKCYMEMAKMIGTHYPSLGLSFLWKARVFYETVQDTEKASFTKSRMALAYFLLWQRVKESRFLTEAKRMVNDDIKRENFAHPGAQASFDRLKGLINEDLALIESSMNFFEGIQAYGDFLRSTEFYIKTCLTLGDRDAAKQGAKRYENAALRLDDKERLAYIRGIDIDKAEASWIPVQEKKDMPDLLDILESLAYDEEWFHLDKSVIRSLYPTHYQEGMFSAVMFADGKARLYPCALYPNRYYRGQSDKLEGKACKPSLFRNLPEEDVFHERLCLKELENLLQYHPMTMMFEGMMRYKTSEGPKPLSLNVDYTALGQHYGVKTDVLDLTADKWVAAFFASTEYRNGEYLPYKGEDEGVVYIYQHVPALNEALDRLSAVGLQPFSRPGCQAGLVYRMLKDKDFNKKAKRVVFKHNPAIAELIFNYCNRSKKLFPEEILEQKVSEIRASKVYSSWALTLTLGTYYKDEKESVIQGYIDKLGITFQSAPPVMFTEKEMKDFIEKWNKEKKHFFDSVLVMPQYVMPKVEE